MKEHKYLDNHKSAKCIAAILALLTLAFGAASLLFPVTSGTAGWKLVTSLCAASAVVLVCFVIHYINRNAESKMSSYTGALHAGAVHAILMIALLLLAGLSESFSFCVIHALLDGVLAAALLLLSGALLGKKTAFISVIAGLAAAALSLLWKDTALNILLALLGLICVVAAIAGIKHSGAIYALLLGAATAVVCALGLDKVDMASGLHGILHVLVMALVCLLFFAVARIAPRIQKEETTRAPKARENTADEDYLHEMDTVLDIYKNSDERGDVFDRDKWIIKKYQGLSAAELMLAPVDALYGVSESDALLLKESFGIKTIGDLADNKFFSWAEEICEEADALAE